MQADILTAWLRDDSLLTWGYKREAALILLLGKRFGPAAILLLLTACSTTPDYSPDTPSRPSDRPQAGTTRPQGSDAAWEPFKCPGCSIVYPVVEGMPILLPANAGDEASAVVFEDQWRMQAEGHFERDTLYGETAEQELQSFLGRFGIREPSELAGKRILDIGCGNGRLTRNLAVWAPRAVVVGGERICWIKTAECE